MKRATAIAAMLLLSGCTADVAPPTLPTAAPSRVLQDRGTLLLICGLEAPTGEADRIWALIRDDVPYAWAYQIRSSRVVLEVSAMIFHPMTGAAALQPDDVLTLTRTRGRP